MLGGVCGTACLVVLALLPTARASVAPLEVYRSLLRSHPLRTNMVTASLISVTSDAISQTIERRQAVLTRTSRPASSAPPSSALQGAFELLSKKQGHDYYRSLTMSVYGAAVFGAFVSWWFSVLSCLVPVTDLRSVLLKVLVNQFFMSPFLNSLFFAWVTLTRNPGDRTLTLPARGRALGDKLRVDLAPTILR